MIRHRLCRFFFLYTVGHMDPGLMMNPNLLLGPYGPTQPDTSPRDNSLGASVRFDKTCLRVSTPSRIHPSSPHVLYLSMSVESPIDLPLERSLYVGNFMRGILYGAPETWRTTTLVLITLVSRYRALHLLPSRSPYPQSTRPVQSSQPSSLRCLWCHLNDDGHNCRDYRRTLGRVHVDRPQEPSRRAVGILRCHNVNVDERVRVCCRRHGEHSR